MARFKVILGLLVYLLDGVLVYGAESMTRGSSLIRPSVIHKGKQITNRKPFSFRQITLYPTNW